MNNTTTTAPAANEAASTETKAKFPVTDETTGITDCGPDHAEAKAMKTAEDKTTGHVLALPLGEGGAIVFVTKYLLTAIYESKAGKQANKALRAENGEANKAKAKKIKDRKDAQWTEVVRVGAIIGVNKEELEKSGVRNFWFLNKKTQKAICLSHNSEMGTNSLRTYINFKSKNYTMPQAEMDRREELLKIMLLSQFIASYKASKEAFEKFADVVGVDRKDIAEKNGSDDGEGEQAE
jgi:hypothetical protein